MDALLVRHSNLGPILHHFKDIAGFCTHNPTPRLFHPNLWGHSHCTRLPMLGSARAEALRYLAVKLFWKYSNLSDHGTWTSQTDRWRDRQTDDILSHNRTPCSIAR